MLPASLYFAIAQLSSVFRSRSERENIHTNSDDQLIPFDFT